MNFASEQAGKPPSAVAEFDNDLLTSSSQWADEVKAGSDRYGRWQKKLEQSGRDIDPVDLFDPPACGEPATSPLTSATSP